MAKIGVVLSGCGVMDGSEIHESVLTLLAISQEGHEAICMAPDVAQTDVINHLAQKPLSENRNVLIESARIARGNIKNIREIKAADIDALIFPGGFGAAKNLCSFAKDGSQCTVQPDVACLAQAMHTEKKPIGSICIAPALIAKIFEGENIQLTIGNDSATAKQINQMGQMHQDCEVREICVDEEKRMVSTPAYMLAQNLGEAHEGIKKLVKEITRMIQTPATK